jgi:hypothetical protein
VTQYEPMAPNISVYGQTTSVFIEVLKQFSVLQRAMLDALGVERFEPHAWYPQRLILRAYQKVDLLLGARGLERFGRQIPALVTSRRASTAPTRCCPSSTRSITSITAATARS